MVAANLSEKTMIKLRSALGRDEADDLAMHITVSSPQSLGGDPTGVNDSSAAFVRSLELFGSVVIPSGHTYRLATGIVMSQGQSIIGYGKNSRINYTGSGVAISYDERCHLSNFCLVGNEAGRESGSVGLGENTTYPSDFDRIVRISDVLVSYFEDGIRADFNGCFIIDNAYVEHCDNGLHVTGTQVNAMTVIGGEFRECINGVLDDSSGGTFVNNYIGVTIEGNSQFGYKKTTGGSNCQFLGCYFELNDTQIGHDGADIFVDSPGLILCFQIRHCYFGGTNTAIDMEAGLGGEIDYNFFSFVTNTIKLGASTRYVKVGNGNIYTAGTEFSPAVNDLGTMNETNLSPAQWGVRGDGSTDDTAALQAWLAANPKCPVLPRGTYILSATLQVPANCRLTGCGWENTVLKAKAGFVGPLLEIGSEATVRDLKVLGLLAANSIGVRPAASANRWLLERVYISSVVTGLDLNTGSTLATIRDCRFEACTGVGILVSAVTTTLNILESGFNASGKAISFTAGAIQTRVAGCRVSNSTAHGIEASAATQAMLIEANSFSSNAGADINLITTSQVSTTIRNNRFLTTPTSVIIVFADGTIIEGNMFAPGGGGPKSIDIQNAGAVGTEIRENTYSSGAFVYATHNLGVHTKYRGQIFSAAAPAAGTWDIGEVVWNSAPASGQPPFWLCSAAGTPGTWKPAANLP